MKADVIKMDEERFERLLKGRLGSSWERAFAVFRNYGAFLAYDVSHVLLHGVNQGKVEEVLKILEKHYAEEMEHQAPEVRGRVANAFGHNKTKRMFIGLFEKTLGFKAARL